MNYPSLKQVNIPFNIDGMQARILTDVVDCEVPLLLSKQSMKAANSKLDFVNDKVTMFGKDIPLHHTSNGHFCIPLTPIQIAIKNTSPEHSPVKVTFSATDFSKKSTDEKQKAALKLHKQFGHPIDSTKLKTLLQNGNIHDDELYKLIDDVTNSCDTCSRYMKARSRPIVSLPFASDVSDVLAMDLKFITVNGRKAIILHMIDVFSRFSVSSLITSRHAKVIVDSILRMWVSIFGTPRSILSDNGGGVQ